MKDNWLPLTLVSATPSPWARKVRIVLNEKRIPFELRNDVPWAENSVVPEYNPLEKLPILLTGNGESIFESRFIVEWLDRHFPEHPIIPQDDDGFLACKKIELLVDGTLDASLLLSFERMREHPDNDWAARQKRKVSGGLSALARLIDGQSFAVGNAFSLADVALGTMLASFDFGLANGLSSSEADWRAHYPHLVPYLDELSRRPSFMETTPTMFEFDFAARSQSGGHV